MCMGGCGGGSIASQAIVRTVSQKPKIVVSSGNISNAMQRPKGTYAAVRKIVR